MPPTLILIRHGEALHNVAQEYDIPDPELSDLGKRQCAAMEKQLRYSHPLADQVELIISSPMIRTIQTTNIGLDWLIKRGVPVELDPLWQENSSKPCDTGTPIPKLKKEFPDLDFSTVDPAYPDKGLDTPYAFTRSAVLARGQTCLRNLYNRKEKVIAVVSHSGFLRCAITRCKYANADFRIFDFADPSPDSDGLFKLTQWPSTADNGGGMGTSEPGFADLTATDFPPEKAEAEAIERGEGIENEAAKEVPARP